MRFHELPYRLRLYILAHPVALIPLAAWALRRPLPDQPLLVGMFLLFTVVFSTWRVELTIFQGRMTPTFAIICLALLLQGLQAALLCAAVGAFVGILVRPTEGHRSFRIAWPPFHRIAFNVFNSFIACVTGAMAFDVVTVLAAPYPYGRTVVGLIVFTGVYFAVNTIGVSLAIAYQQKLRVLVVWRENFLWTAPGYLASATFAGGIHAAYSQMGSWSLLLVPPIYVIYYSYRLYLDKLHEYAAQLRREMRHIQELNELNQSVIASLATAIEAKDRATFSHVNRIQHYATVLGKAAGLNDLDLQAVSTGALVHDIGKLGIPDHILSKPGKLTMEEFRRMQSHVTIGTEILSPIPFPFPVVDVVRTHHERWDGLGYPQGLRGEEIPIGGRIMSIADVFDALTSDRPYRRAMPVDEALVELKRGAGKEFDPRLVEMFEQVLERALAEVASLESARQAVEAERHASAEGTFALTQIHQAAAEMAAVCDVVHSLAELETFGQVSQVIVNRALALLPAETAILYVKSPVAPELAAVAVEGRYGEKLQGMVVQVGEGIAGWVAQQQQPMVNASAMLDIARRFTPQEDVELSAATAVPMLHEANVLGVLAVYTEGYGVLTEHHLHLLNILSEHAAAAIQNVRRMEQHRELAYTDALTGASNSRGLIRHLERLTYPADGTRPGAGQPFSLLMLDLDRFKEVNDTLGHLRGDELLKRVAQTLTEVARPDDVVCRYAGDEFVVLLPGAHHDAADQVASRIRGAVAGLSEVTAPVAIGISIGAASFPGDGPDGRALLQMADQRMYEDKFRRRNRDIPLRTADLAPLAVAGR
jgi:diguanylate cyclase (GGDEF)-like protein/putative nucleotidyltransferase with HDIG domain